MTALSSEEFASWLQPMMGPTTAVAAAIRGDNPFEAARTQSFQSAVVGYDEEGNPIHGIDWSQNDVSQELIDRGVHPLLAMAIDMAFVPDPIGVGKAADLIPLLSLIGPAGLRMMMKHGSQIQWMPAGLLAEAAGNPMRRAIDDQTEFRRLLQYDPGGLHEPAVIIYDPQTLRWYTGEGNHRVRAAVEADSPVPVTVIRGRVPSERGLPIPPEGVEALQNLAEARHGYSPGTATPGQLGLPTYDEASMLEYARARGEWTMNPLTDDELAEVAQVLGEAARKADQGVSPQVGSTLARSAEIVDDYTPTIEWGARNRMVEMMKNGDPAADSFPTEGSAYVRHMLNEYGYDEGMRLIQQDTGLTPSEIDATIGRWADADTEAMRAMDEGGVLARSPDMPTEPPYPLGEDPRVLLDEEFNRLADEGGAIVRSIDKSVVEIQAGNFSYRTMDLIENIRNEDEFRAAINALASEPAYDGLRNADPERLKALINRAVEDWELANLANRLPDEGAAIIDAIPTGWEPSRPRQYSGPERKALAARINKEGVPFGDLTPQSAYGSYEYMQSLLEADAYNMERMMGNRNGWSLNDFTPDARAKIERQIAEAEEYLDAGDALGLFGDQSQRDLFVGAIDDAKAKLASITGETAPPVTRAVRFNTGNPDWDTRMGALTGNMQRFLDGLDAGRPLDPAQAGVMFNEAQGLISEVRGMSPEAWMNRGEDVDDALILLNEYLNVLRRVDPLGGTP